MKNRPFSSRATSQRLHPIDTEGAIVNVPATNTARIADHPYRRPALAAAVSLLLMAVLASLANFAILQALVIPTDAAATVTNIAASMGSFRIAIAAFLVVAILDVVVAWGLYVVLRPASESLALLVAWLRVVYAAVFAYALVNLLDVAQLLQGPAATGLAPAQIPAQVATSIAAFNHGWDLALAIFGLHLVGLGALLIRSIAFPTILGGLVLVAGVGYLADSFGTILVADYSLSISTFTFIGEALLIAWLFKFAVRGSFDRARDVGEAPFAPSADRVPLRPMRTAATPPPSATR